jgi:hypothetical protein
MLNNKIEAVWPSGQEQHGTAAPAPASYGFGSATLFITVFHHSNEIIFFFL